MILTLILLKYHATMTLKNKDYIDISSKSDMNSLLPGEVFHPFKNKQKNQDLGSSTLYIHL